MLHTNTVHIYINNSLVWSMC